MRKFFPLLFFILSSGFLFGQIKNTENTRKTVVDSNGLSLNKAPKSELKVVNPKQALERQKKIEQVEEGEKEFTKFAESDGKTSPYEMLILNRYKITKENIR